MQKGSVLILILLGVLLLAGIAGGGYYFGRQTSKSIPQQIACTMDAKICPDGTGVGRVGPKCEFAPCPSTEPNSNETADWKTYTNTKASYSFKYPLNWIQSYVNFSGCSECIDGLVLSPNQIPDLDSDIVTIQVYKEDKIKTLDDYVNIHVKGDASKINLNYATVGGEKAVSYKLSGGMPPLPIIEYAVVKNGYQYILRIEDGKETNKNRDKNIQIFNKILSTFKFL
ncbi:MAG: hypothetical protein Q7R49_01010 [Candidatus Daviesbacteria bacterium]|nr:hypothetical protein [Candidatus Daviesbacteria bacterium]